MDTAQEPGVDDNLGRRSRPAVGGSELPGRAGVSGIETLRPVCNGKRKARKPFQNLR
jgi:hypothetical protein